MEKQCSHKLYIKVLYYILYIAITILGIIFYLNLYLQIPKTIRITAGKEEAIEWNLPLSGEIVSLNENKALPVNLMNPIVVKGSSVASYQMNLRIWGVIPIKQVDIQVIPETYLIPVGIPVGIYVKTEGVLVIGVGDFQGMDGMQYAPSKYVLQEGDYIVKINDQYVNEKEEIVALVENSDGEDLIMTINRNGLLLNLKVSPIMSSVNCYKIGVWLRDNAQGIGTITYVNAEGQFGALGHGINDVDLGGLLTIDSGTLYETSIISVKRGVIGEAGEITGLIAYADKNILGVIQANSSNGIFGYCNLKGSELSTHLEPMQIGFKQEVREGAATIISTINGERKEYDIVIDKIYIDSVNENRGLLIEVVDEELLELTGGIVQGMSGAPVLQNGKLIGAVTHVFVNDPTRGYGIFVENMLETAEGIE